MFSSSGKPLVKVCSVGGKPAWVRLVDNGDGGGGRADGGVHHGEETRELVGSRPKIETSEPKNRAGGDVPTRRGGGSRRSGEKKTPGTAGF